MTKIQTRITESNLELIRAELENLPKSFYGTLETRLYGLLHV